MTSEHYSLIQNNYLLIITATDYNSPTDQFILSAPNYFTILLLLAVWEK